MKKTEQENKTAWLLTATLKNWQIAEERGIFGLHGNNANFNKIKKGDQYVAYVPQIGFIGHGVVAGERFESKLKLWEDKTYNRRFSISTPLISDRVLPGGSVVDDLSFVTDKKHWGAFFKAGIREIPIADALLVEERLKKSAAVLEEIKENINSKNLLKNKEIGDELHNKVFKLFDDLGFNIIDNNYYSAGPDIVVVDPEDVNKGKIIIQCKNSKQPKKNTFSNLDKHLNEYAGRLRSGAAKAAIIVVSGQKLPKKVPGESEELDIEDVQKRYGVSIWTDETLEYYIDLIEKISHFARYQVLSDLGLRLNFDKAIKADAIKIVQNGYTMYAASFSPEWLLKSVSVVRRIRSANGPKGYQRLLAKNRIAKSENRESISNYLDTNTKWLFPNAIVLASSRSSGLAYDGSKLEIKSSYGQFWVIDGQHRLFAFANSEARLSKNKLLCVVIDAQSLGSEHEEERELAQIFVTLNGRGKRVPKALLYELYQLLGSEDNPQLEVVLKLVEDNFFADCIRGYSDKGGSINLVAFADAKGVESIYKYFKSTYDKKSKEDIVDISAKYILESFEEVARVFDDEWNDPDHYFLKTDRGIRGILELLNLVLHKYDQKIQHVSQVIEALKTGQFDFSSDTAKGLYLGAGGPVLLAESFAKHITKTIKDFSPTIFSIEIDNIDVQRGEIAQEKIAVWIGTLEGDVRCHMPHIDKTTIKYLGYLNAVKVKRARMFFAKYEPHEEKAIKHGLIELRKSGLNITVTQENKRTMHGGSIIHERFIGDDKHGFITDADLKDQSQRNTIMHLHFYQWNKPAELDNFDRYWDVAEKSRDIEFGYDWGNLDN